MKNMSLIEISSACGGTFYGSSSFENQVVSGVAIDSRKIKKDFLFIPIKGAQVDGHDYIPQVIKNGALCTLSEHVLVDPTFPYIHVDSTQQALKDIAEHYRKSLNIKVVGITGSVGKTSTKEMIASVLSQKYNTLKTEGNFNNEIGVPLTIFNLTEEHEVAVLEMGINHFGEMNRLSKIARPDIVVMTNIGRCHLEFLGDLDGVLKAKSEIFNYMNPEGTIILNGEDEKLSNIGGVQHMAPHFFGLSPECYTYADEINNQGLKGIDCHIHLSPERSFHCRIPIPGGHMVLNALAGSAVGMELGLSEEEIKNGIESLVPLSGRNKITSTDHYTIIDDCYNANPESMKASLDVLATATTRKVAILGDMGELGPDAPSIHESIGQYAVNKKVDILCCVGELCHHMAAGGENEQKKCNNSFTKIHYFETKKILEEHLSCILQDKDSILIKASHFMKFDQLVTHLTTTTIK